MVVLGCDERSVCGTLEYLLVLTYAGKGNLQEYLSNNIVDWKSAVKLMMGITQGLAHLHSRIEKGGKLGTNTSEILPSKF